MTSTTASKNKWNRVNGTWRISLGSRGCTVRLFENRKTGVYYRDVWVDGRKDRRSLHTANKAKAEELGRRILLRLLTGKLEEESSVVTLGSLWERFRTQCEDWLDNKPQSRKDDERSAKLLLAFFGEDADVSLLSKDAIARFRKERLRGGIELPDGEITASVRARSAQADLQLLRMMCRWAVHVPIGGGRRLLQANPLDGIKIAGEKNELRPVATWERYKRTRSTIAKLASECSSEKRPYWSNLNLLLVISEATGRRIGSVRHLRWEDLDFTAEQILWRAEADKGEKEAVTPMGAKLSAYLKRIASQRSASTGWLFPSAKNPDVHMSDDQVGYWLRKAEKEAGIPKLKGGLWHAYRRKWGTDKKDLPVKDVMAVGGWADMATFLRSYQQTDHDTQLRVMNDTRKHSDSAPWKKAP
jgi:integrase